MYLSHPVRRIRDDPTPGESVPLVVERAASADPDAIEEAIADLDGDVDRNLGFDAVLVTVPETSVAALTERDDVARIETANTISLGLDSGAKDDADREAGGDRS
ncbi:hypothetical protein [Halegenticoccus tardaugens]|uniref:hypothetical protein n=1 Tax=Halegenticoccus tardaugens TaxID=2071624 RepID=UPI001E37EAD8|nr:hypothetical protein [Halegenticoccus tardaugens]